MRNTFLTTLLALSCWQCTSANEPTPASPSRVELLTAKNWRVSTASITPAYNFGGRRITDWYGIMGTCLVDDFIRFDKPNVLTISERTEVCTNSPIKPGLTWALSNDDKTLTQYDRMYETNFTYTIESLEAERLILTRQMMTNGETYTMRFMYIKQ